MITLLCTVLIKGGNSSFMFILFKFYIYFLNLPNEEDHLEPYFCLPALLYHGLIAETQLLASASFIFC